MYKYKGSKRPLSPKKENDNFLKSIERDNLLANIRELLVNYGLNVTESEYLVNTISSYLGTISK